METGKCRKKMGLLTVLIAALAAASFALPVFAENCDDAGNQRAVILCLSQYVNIQTSNGAPTGTSVAGGFQSQSHRIGVYGKLVLLEDTPYAVSNVGAVVSNKTDVRNLCSVFGLLETPSVNPQLRFQEGDISYWSERRLQHYDLVMELVARKLVLDKADADGVAIATQGDLSFFSMNVYDKLYDAWEDYIF